MAFLTWCSYFVGLWASVYLTDTILRSNPYTRQRYYEFTARLGISFDILQARFFTQRLNQLFQVLCRFDFVPWKAWFTCGVVFSTICMVLSIGLLSLLVYNTLTKKSIKGGTLTPVMPGVNLPISHMGFYMLTLLLCAFLHEAGHAMAAVRERVRLHGFGVFLFGFYPGAYVDLNTADLQSLKPLGQLRVYCAGVWHNVIIAVFSAAVFYAIPLLLSPGYHIGTGVGVTFLRENSVVTGHRGLSLGDAITRINSCPVTNQSDWYRCLEEAHTDPSGYCVSGHFLRSLDPNVRKVPKLHAGRRNLAAVVSKSANEPEQSVNAHPLTDCCAHQSASTHLCFTYSIPSTSDSRTKRYACLPARTVTEQATCRTASDCGSHNLIRTADDTDGTQGSAHSSVLERPMMCVVPSPPDNQTRLVRLLHNRKDAPAILFLGPLEDLLASVGVSDYVSRWPGIFPPNFPALLGLFCTYLFSLSGALVILNVVPCYALDGQWILKALIELCFARLLPCKHKRHFIFRILLFVGTMLLCSNVVLAFWYFFLDANLGSVRSLVPSEPAPIDVKDVT